MDDAVGGRLEAAQKERATELFLGSAGLASIPEEVFALSSLEYLDLTNNKLETVPQRLWNLPNLRRVVLYGNPLTHLPNCPGLMIDGTTYVRLRNQFDQGNIAGLLLGADMPEDSAEFWVAELRTLQSLRELTVGKWSITIGERHPAPGSGIRKILDSLVDLTFLEGFILRGWDLAVVPESIRALRRLNTLDLSGLGLQSLPDWIGDLEFEHLSVFDNRLTVVPRSLGNRRLKRLDLSWNPLQKVPEVVFSLVTLEYLDLTKCGLRAFPADVLRLSHLKDLYLNDNAIESPPAEVVKQGLEAIRNYWRQRADTGVDYLCEAKLIILGEAGAGKTSLARKIQDPDYKLRERDPSTEGIDVIRYQFPTTIRTREDGREKILQRDFQVNIWDFGGQEIYHATHQFFLTRRSVYVLVCDDRKEDTDFSYWLQVVEMLTDASPLLIVQNEKQDRTRDIDPGSLRARFPNLRDVVATNLDTNRGLDRVIQSIRKELESLPHVGIGLPATWKRVREALEQDQRDYVGLDEYLAMCQQYGFTRREDKLQLSGYLHDLGICLHFQDDPLLKNTVVLKPAWGTDAVYRVLDDSAVVAARGRFTQEDLQRIWFEAKYAGMQDELLRLMMKFRLCYALEDERAYIAPQLLSAEQPGYPWDASGGLVVRYEYGFLPKGILTRFIVAAHHLIADEKLVWKTGVILERDGTRAEVTEEYTQRRIRVRISGPDPRGLLAIVDDQMEKLHSYFPRLQYDRHLPCPCTECQGKLEPYAFPLEKLAKMAAKGQSIQCYASGEMVDAAQLIRNVLPGALRREERFAGPAPMSVSAGPPSQEVFVSYAWTEESRALVDRLQGALEQQGVRLLRDRGEVRYKDSIRAFMRRIGKGKCVVVVISEKYLKSENCMFEMLEVADAGALRERIFPIVLPDANIYTATGRVRYVRHWEEQIRELDEALKTVRGDNLTELQDDLNLYSEIRRLFGRIADTLRDMNALTADQHEGTEFEELTRRILAQVGP